MSALHQAQTTAMRGRSPLQNFLTAAPICCHPAANSRKARKIKWLPDMDSNHDEELSQVFVLHSFALVSVRLPGRASAAAIC
jgi:hypothetical protein